MVPAYLVGNRDGYYADTFVEDLASRLNARPQISSDALSAYVDAVERGFGANADYGQLVKVYAAADMPSNGDIAPRN
jgi:hypothetical protein